jgi:hypothetical protein
MIAYAVYNYAFYLFGAVLNVFFPLYIIAMVQAVIALMLALSRLDAAAVAGSFRRATSVRAIGGFLAFVGRTGGRLDCHVGRVHLRGQACARRP